MRSDLPRRRLTMADLVVLTGGTALSLGLLRMSWDDLASRILVMNNPRAFRVAHAISPGLLGLAAAFLTVRLLPPRPRWVRLWRQPGTVACLAILGQMLLVVLNFSWHVFLMPILSRPIYYRPHFNTYLDANREAGAWVAVAWTTLALARAWRAEASWIDRSGRALGIVAILHWLWSALLS